jgi:phosphotriesterase-related protein
MRNITTVLGDIDSEALGFCQSHEHLSIARSCPIAGGPERCIDDPEKSLAELRLYHAAGGRALVDAQPVGCGREAAVLARIAEQSGVHIIASTGFHKLSFYPNEHWIHSQGEDELARLFVSELADGMYLDGDTAFPRRRGGVRAGQIKTALDTEGLSPPYVKLFSAAVIAAKATGCALMAHIERGADPLRLAGFFERQGLPPDRLVFCHLDRAIANIAVHREICRRGIYLEYDTIGRPRYHDDGREADIILQLAEAGYESRILMSMDSTRARLRSYGGKPGLAYIIECFIPLLRRRGFTEAQIGRFFRENPARLFATMT